MSAPSWIAPSPAAKYGGAVASPNTAATRDATELPKVAPAPELHAAGFLDPHEPLFWFGVVAAVSVGLMAYSTTVRVGPATVTVDAGKV